MSPPNDTLKPASSALEEIVAAALRLALPADAHVIGETVVVTRIHSPSAERMGLRATCQRGEREYDVSLADVTFEPGSAGAHLAARYRVWLGVDDAEQLEWPLGPVRAHKVASDDVVVGKPVELVVLACKSNALRCRLLGTARELTLRTAVRDEIPGAIVTLVRRSCGRTRATPTCQAR